MEAFVFARLHARPGKRGEVHRAMFEVQAPTRNEPGCLAYGAFQSVRDSPSSTSTVVGKTRSLSISMRSCLTRSASSEQSSRS